MHAAFNHKGLNFVGSSIFLISAAQVLLKMAVSRAGSLLALIDISTVDTVALTCLIVGLLCYGLSFVLWQRALGDIPLSIAYPLLSLSYPLVYIATLLLPAFSETINLQRITGILLILIGAALLAPRENAAHSHS